jgi:hypothetical protein
MSFLLTMPLPRLGRHSVTDVWDNWGCTLVLRDLKTTPNLAEVLCGWIGMMIQVGA